MKPIAIRFELSPQTEPETRAVLEDMLEVLTRYNQRFYQQYPNAHCCPKCGGVEYRPPTPEESRTTSQSFVCVERMLTRRHGACGDVAAMVCARMRELEGKTDARVVLIPQGAGTRQYHAVVRVGGELVDATKEMQRKAPGCACEVK